MKPILYLETNYLIGVSKGQLISVDYADRLIKELFPDIQVVMPDICIMEALSVLESERKDRNRLRDFFSQHVREAKRDRVSGHALTLVDHLKNAMIESDEHLAEIEIRLYKAIRGFANDAELISLSDTILASFTDSTLLDDPTDNLILHCIGNHALAHPQEKKAFASGNSRDFRDPSVSAFLNTLGVQYFENVDAALGWLRVTTPE